MVKIAKDYIEKKPRRHLCSLRDPLTMDDLILDRLGLEYHRFIQGGLGNCSYTAVELSDGQVISISKYDHQNGRIAYSDNDDTYGGVIILEYDYGTWTNADPMQFPDYDVLVKFVLRELMIEPHEILLPSVSFTRDSHSRFIESYRDFSSRKG